MLIRLDSKLTSCLQHVRSSQFRGSTLAQLWPQPLHYQAITKGLVRKSLRQTWLQVADVVRSHHWKARTRAVWALEHAITYRISRQNCINDFIHNTLGCEEGYVFKAFLIGQEHWMRWPVKCNHFVVNRRCTYSHVYWAHTFGVVNVIEWSRYCWLVLPK